jgi:hypothetical protein
MGVAAILLIKLQEKVMTLEDVDHMTVVEEDMVVEEAVTAVEAAMVEAAMEEVAEEDLLNLATIVGAT